MDSVELRLSLDDGATFPILIANPEPEAGSYDWTIPEVYGDSVRVRLELMDGVGFAATAASERFSIACAVLDAESPPPVTPEFRLGRSMPNPAVSSARISYTVAEPGQGTGDGE